MHVCIQNYLMNKYVVCMLYVFFYHDTVISEQLSNNANSLINDNGLRLL
jgi:hypothetical protein